MAPLRCSASLVLVFFTMSCGNEGTGGAAADNGGAIDSGGSGGNQTTGGAAGQTGTAGTTGDTSDSGGAGGPGADGIIPSGRRIDWTHTGVPGGIPTRTTICATIDAAKYGDGASDASAAINAAIQSCPADQVVLLTAGKFKIQSRIQFQFKSGVTLRGAGPDKTVLLPVAAAIVLGDDNPAALTATVSGGTTKGSTSLTLSSTDNLVVGALLKIDRLNAPGGANDPTDADLVHDVLGKVYVAPDPGRRIAQMVAITAIQGNTVTISPPLFWDFSASPALTYFSRAIAMSGVEDLKIDHSQGGDGSSIDFDQAYGCWAKNISSYKPGGYHSVDINSVLCEVRDSYFDDSKTYGPDNAGLALYGPNTGWKIENNVFSRSFPGVELQLASSGNYIGYNYAFDVMTGGDMSGVVFDDNHAPHDMMNLWEGNVGEMFQSDGYFGSASHGTVFRNNFTATNSSTNLNYKAISLNRWSYYYNVVGNVLGSPSWPAGGVYEIDKDGYSYATPVVFQLGYPNMGNNSFTSYDGKSPAGLDAKVKSTLIRYKNYDYVHKAVSTDSTDIPDQPLPASLRYSGKPAWWPASIPWPPIGPDVAGFSNKIPAQIRFDQGIP